MLKQLITIVLCSLIIIMPLLACDIQTLGGESYYTGEPIAFVFSPSSLSGNLTYIWNFGFNNAPTSSFTTISNSLEESNIYSSEGTYTITLTVENTTKQENCSKTISIDEKGEVHADFHWSDNPKPNEIIYLMSNSTSSGSTSITSYEWTIDENKRYGDTVSCILDKGAHNIQLKVTGAGVEDTITKTLTLSGGNDIGIQGDGLDFNPSFISRPFKQNIETSFTVNLLNTYDFDLTILDLKFISGTTITELGEQPVTIGNIATSTLTSKSLLTIPLDVNTKDIPIDVYHCVLHILAKDANNNFYSEQLNLDLRVTPGVLSGNSVKKEFSIDIPQTVKPHEEFEIKVNGLSESSEVWIYLPETAETKDNYPQRGNNTWIWKGNISKEGNVDIIVIEDGIAKKYTRKINTETQETKSAVIKVSPEPPKPSDTVTIETDPIGLNIKIIPTNEKGQVLSEINNNFVANAGWEYNITVKGEGYETKTKILKIDYLPLTISLSPPKPKLGDDVSVKFMSGRDEISDIDVKVNGRHAYLPLDFKNITEGFYNINTESKIYKQSNISFEIKSKVIILNTPEQISIGQPVMINLSREASWSVKYNGSLYATGYSNTIEFIPSNAGEYSIDVEGNTLKLTTTQTDFYMVGSVVLLLIILGLLFVNPGYLKDRLPSSFKKKSGGSRIINTESALFNHPKRIIGTKDDR